MPTETLDNSLLRLLLQATPDIVVLKDGAGRWVLANDAAIQLFYLTDLPFEGLTDRALAERHSLIPSVFRICGETDRATWRARRRCVYEEHVPQPGSETVVLETIKTPIFNPDGSRRGILIVGRDVTDRKRVERENSEQKLHLEKARELDQMKTNLVNAVSHELRTPIMTIMGYAEFLEDNLEGSLSEAQQDYVRQIQFSSKRLQLLVDDLLDFARIEAGTLRLTLQDAEFGALVRNAVLGFYPQASQKQILLETRLPTFPLPVSVDPTRIEQVLINLIGNALKFTHSGGSIMVALTADDDHVQVDVRDTGIGIAAEHIPSLFQKFYQIDASLTRTRGGAGLGLSISEALITAHGGQIGVTSELGQGSTFWIRLPRNPGAPPSASELGDGSVTRVVPAAREHDDTREASPLRDPMPS